MIGYLEGKVQFLREEYLILLVHGVGYRILTTPQTLGKAAKEKHVALFITTYVREDALALYGFLTEEERNLFELLLSISGIGPKAALSILALADPKSISAAIAQGDVSLLTRVSGVGKKTAERVILELRNKITSLPGGMPQEKLQTPAFSEALEALQAMGYSSHEARQALAQVGDEEHPETQIKKALQILGKKL